MDDHGRRLLRAGMRLCLLALLTGLALPAFANPRMALAAHVGGMMNGIFLLVAGLAWRELELAARWRSVAFFTLLAGTYGNWASTTAAAAWGTRSLTPIAGAGFGAGRAQETIVTAGLVVVGVAMLAATTALLVGLRRRR
jgi:hydroxylaminobenzene mutase